MMRASIGAAFALALLAGPALAQATPPVPPPQNGGGPGVSMPSAEPPEDQARSSRDGEAMGGERRWRHPLHRMSKAAGFRVETGDVTLGIRCPEDEPMKVCGDFTLQLLDKIGSIPHHRD